MGFWSRAKRSSLLPLIAVGGTHSALENWASFAGRSWDEGLGRADGKATCSSRRWTRCGDNGARMGFGWGNASFGRHLTGIIRSTGAGDGPPKGDRSTALGCRTLFQKQRRYETDTAALARGLCLAAETERRHPMRSAETPPGRGGKAHLGMGVQNQVCSDRCRDRTRLPSWVEGQT